MKSLSYPELKSFASWLQNVLEGAQLQDIWTNGEVIIFEFYKFKSAWLCLDMTQNFPQVVYLEKAPPFKKSPKPITVFLNAHAKNLRWIDCQVDVDKGRVFEFEVTNGDKSCFLEFIAIPRMVNLIAKSEGKSISWDKPKELLASNSFEHKAIEEADWIARGKQWLLEKTERKSSSESSQSQDPRLKVLAKKQSAFEKMKEQLELHPEELWKEMGELLKAVDVKSDKDLDEKYHKIYDFKSSRQENRDHAFNKYKDLKRKRSGTEERLKVLEKEIKDLQKKIEKEVYTGGEEAPRKGNRLLEKSESRGRRLILEDGIEAVIGKSARDNLGILRQAQAWDLWLHLKDYPGAHAIIVRPRNKDVPQKMIQKVSEWLINESFSGKKINMGAKYDVVVVECRHVRPIKGDKLGRVTYHHPQVFSFASKS